MIRRVDSVGRFSVEVELANYDDIARARAGDISADQVRRTAVRGVVDSGAARLVIPESVANQLALTRAGEASVRFAGGRMATRDVAIAVELTYAGRSNVFDAIIEPGRQDALIGAIVMEALDLIIDCAHQSLVPRDPDRIISEIE
jgi:predicted aspartyl protease